MPEHTRPGDVLADRYRLTDLLTESGGGRFWRAFDSVLQRDVAVHIIACDDERAPLLREAARRRRPCSTGGCCGCSTSTRPPTAASWSTSGARAPASTSCSPTASRCRRPWPPGSSPRSPTPWPWPTTPAWPTAAWSPRTSSSTSDGAVRLIGFAVDAALHGLPAGRVSTDVVDLVGLLYAALTGRWAGVSRSAVTAAPSTARSRAATPPGAGRHPAHPRRRCASTSSTTGATPRSPPRW